MKNLLIAFGISFFPCVGCISQNTDKTISSSEVARIEKTLSSDDMQGRGTFTPGIDAAAIFIADEFKKAGILPWDGKNYFQEFTMQRLKFISASGIVNGTPIETKNIVVISSSPDVVANNKLGYEIITIGSKDTLRNIVGRLLNNKSKYILFVDTSQTRAFNALKRRTQGLAYPGTVVMILGAKETPDYSVEFHQQVTDMPLKNVVGILPGKSKKDEYVIFSGHYDHLGIGKPNAEGDSLYNGANDDASGTTAVIMLANYFAKQHDNERTLVFAAFTAEEIGGFGSGYFSKQFNADKVQAMFNIEMIGTESKWGTNSAYITGYERTNMGDILQKNLEGSKFKFYPDPYPEQQLFFRSDNATLARLGVPAHTISTSKMDSEKYYHTADDEFETLDMKNMTEIIKAIAISSKSIIAGKDTPSRVDASTLVR